MRHLACFIYWLLYLAQLQTQLCSCYILFQIVFSSFSLFWSIVILFPIRQFYQQWKIILCLCQLIVSNIFHIYVLLTGVRWYHIIILICISLIKTMRNIFAHAYCYSCDKWHNNKYPIKLYLYFWIWTLGYLQLFYLLSKW